MKKIVSFLDTNRENRAKSYIDLLPSEAKSNFKRPLLAQSGLTRLPISAMRKKLPLTYRMVVSQECFLKFKLHFCIR